MSPFSFLSRSFDQEPPSISQAPKDDRVGAGATKRTPLPAGVHRIFDNDPRAPIGTPISAPP